MLLSVNANECSEKQGNLMLVLPNKILRPHKLGIAYQTLQVLESSFICNKSSSHAQTATGLMVNWSVILLLKSAQNEGMQ